MSPSDAEHGAVTMNLSIHLGSYIKAHNLGVVFGAETGFKIESDPDTVLAPDIAFIHRDRIRRVPREYMEIAPDLAVEVIFPNERKGKVEKKTSQWLSFGVKSVWLVKPENRTVEMISLSGKGTLLTETDMLSDAVVPGFRIRVGEIFA